MKIIILSLICFLAACSTVQKNYPNNNKDVPVQVEVELNQDNSILLTYTFSEPVIAFKFLRDYSKYRGEYWKPLDADIEVASNEHGLEVVKSKTGKLFSTASFRVLQLKELLDTDYTPMIPFSNGEVLIYPEQFAIINLVNLNSFQTWKPLEESQFPDSQKIMISSKKFKQGIFDGEQHSLPYDVTHLVKKKTDGPYIYLGNQSPSSSSKYTTIVDPNIPKWVRSSISQEFPRAMTLLENKFSFAPPKVPNLFVTQLSFELDRKPRIRGDASSGPKTKAIALMLRGDGWNKPNADRKEDLHRLIVHEPIHIWNSPNITDFATIAWMYEGGAEALRVRTEYELKIRTSEEYQFNHTRYAKRCIDNYIPPLTLDTMKVTPKYDVVYACGFMIGLVTEQILKDKDYFKFWAELLRRARLKQMKYGKEDYFTLLSETSSRKEVITKIRSFIESPQTDRRQELIELLKMVDVKALDEKNLKFKIPMPK